jgi:hypothetical protein
MEAIRACADHVYATDLRFLEGEYLTRSPLQRIQIRLGRGGLIRAVSDAVLRDALRYRPDVLWVDQGLCVAAYALAAVRRETSATCVHFTPDSLYSPGFGNRCFRTAMREYDLCVTTKPSEIDLYCQRGARNVFLTYQGFDPEVHRPMRLTEDQQRRYGCDVAFVDQRMDDRAARLVSLCRHFGSRLSMRLYGRGWEKKETGPILSPLQHGWAAGADYARALCGAKICLAFLNREVGDVYTTRSFEIPACGAFMLAERTELHQEFFTEGIEAEYFGCNEELIDKTEWYLAHEDQRRQIAAAGLARCQRSGYSWRDRMAKCLAKCLPGALGKVG